MITSRLIMLQMAAFFLLFGACSSSCKKQPTTEESPRERASRKASRKRHTKGRRKNKGVPLIIGVNRIRAKVVHVVDGDTVYLRTIKGNQLVKGRLSGVNTPECHKRRQRTMEGRPSAQCISDDETGGYDAFRFLHSRIHGKTVELDCVKVKERCSMGRFGRPLITIFANGVDMNREIIARGWGFTFTKYPSDKRAEYCAAEFAARKAKKGLWKLGQGVDDVLSLMSAKTRRWYKKHDALCRKAMERK